MSFISFIAQNYSQVRASKIRFSDFCLFVFCSKNNALFLRRHRKCRSVMRENKCIGTLAWHSWGYWRLDACTIITVSESCHYSWWSRWLHRVIFRWARLAGEDRANCLWQVSGACSTRRLWGAAVGYAMVMTHCHLICSVKLIHLLYLLCFSRYPWLVSPKFLSFRKNESITWNGVLANTASFHPGNNPRGKEEPSPIRLDRAFSQQGRGWRSWVTERIFQSIR